MRARGAAPTPAHAPRQSSQKPQRSAELTSASADAHIRNGAEAGGCRPSVPTPAARAAAVHPGGAQRCLHLPGPQASGPTAAQSCLAPPRPVPGGGGPAGGGAGQTGGDPTGPGAAHLGPAPIPEGLGGGEGRGREGRRTPAAPHALRFPQSRVRARARPKSRGV